MGVDYSDALTRDRVDSMSQLKFESQKGVV